MHAVQSHGSSEESRPRDGEKERELIRYISWKTGVDESTVLRVLNAEGEFLVLQVKKALKKKDGGVTV